MRMLFFAVVIFSVLSSTSATAKEGAYHKFGMTRNIMTDISNVNDAFGVDISVGYKFKSVSVEGEWIRSEHQGAVGYADPDFSGLNVNLLFPILLKDNGGELYFLAGYGIYKFDLSNGNKWEGNGYNLGLGSDYYFNERAAQIVRLVYRFIEYDEVNNPALRVPQEGDTISVEIGIKYHF